MHLRLPATPEAVALALDALERDPQLLQGLDARARYAVELVTEEVLMNVAMHAGLASSEPLPVGFSACREAASVVLEFVYRGQAFDPREAPPPRPAASLDDARVGGLGLVLVRRMSSAIDHAFTDGVNRLRVVVAERG